MYLDCVHGPDPESTKNSHEKQAQKTQVTTHSVRIEVNNVYIYTVYCVINLHVPISRKVPKLVPLGPTGSYEAKSTMCSSTRSPV
jgi:hypothetical protein